MVEGKQRAGVEENKAPIPRWCELYCRAHASFAVRGRDHRFLPELLKCGPARIR
jgi:hypothetical protein